MSGQNVADILQSVALIVLALTQLRLARGQLRLADIIRGQSTWLERLEAVEDRLIDDANRLAANDVSLVDHQKDIVIEMTRLDERVGRIGTLGGFVAGVDDELGRIRKKIRVDDSILPFVGLVVCLAIFSLRRRRGPFFDNAHTGKETA